MTAELCVECNLEPEDMIDQISIFNSKSKNFLLCLKCKKKHTNITKSIEDKSIFCENCE